MFAENLVINRKEIKYKGIFEDKSTVETLIKEFEKHDYFVSKKRKSVSGKKIEDDLIFLKHKDDYVELKVRVRVTEQSEKKLHEKNKRTVRKGEVNIIFDGFVVDKKTISGGINLVVKVALQNLLNMGSRFAAESSIKSDVKNIAEEINAELHLNKYKLKE